jgi:catechol 2,3-dioxygenase-like lactoylglutathione lyase family enzyme
MQIKLASVPVDDQDKALHFYTTVLGFVKNNVPMGPFRWLTVTSPEGVEGPNSCWSRWPSRSRRSTRRPCSRPVFLPRRSSRATSRASTAA